MNFTLEQAQQIASGDLRQVSRHIKPQQTIGCDFNGVIFHVRSGLASNRIVFDVGHDYAVQVGGGRGLWVDGELLVTPTPYESDIDFEDYTTACPLRIRITHIELVDNEWVLDFKVVR